MRRPLWSAATESVSTSAALPIATQQILAINTAISITAHADIDIPPSGSAPTIDINADSRAPIYSVAPSSTVDIDVDIAALLSTTCVFIARPHLCVFTLRCTAIAALILSASTSVLATACGSFFICLLHLLNHPFETERLIGRECCHVVSAKAKGEHRRSGAQHQQVSHLSHPSSAFAPTRQGAFALNVRTEKKLLS
jgi:hypothetical protein